MTGPYTPRHRRAMWVEPRHAPVTPADYVPRHRAGDTTMPCGCVVHFKTGLTRNHCPQHTYLAPKGTP